MYACTPSVQALPAVAAPAVRRHVRGCAWRQVLSAGLQALPQLHRDWSAPRLLWLLVSMHIRGSLVCLPPFACGAAPFFQLG